MILSLFEGYSILEGGYGYQNEVSLHLSMEQYRKISSGHWGCWGMPPWKPLPPSIMLGNSTALSAHTYKMPASSNHRLFDSLSNDPVPGHKLASFFPHPLEWNPRTKEKAYTSLSIQTQPNLMILNPKGKDLLKSPPCIRIRWHNLFSEVVSGVKVLLKSSLVNQSLEMVYCSP